MEFIDAKIWISKMCHYVGFSQISSQLCEYRVTKYYGYYKPCITYKMPIHTNMQHTTVIIVISTFHILHKNTFA